MAAGRPRGSSRFSRVEPLPACVHSLSSRALTGRLHASVIHRTAILNVVGLTESLLGPATPRLNSLIASGSKTLIEPVLPAVTCTAQSTYLTGLPPAGHGIVANGWYDRPLAEHHFWKQSNHLVHGPKLW